MRDSQRVSKRPDNAPVAGDFGRRQHDLPATLGHRFYLGLRTLVLLSLAHSGVRVNK